jgi:hypothetical protein
LKHKLAIFMILSACWSLAWAQAPISSPQIQTSRLGLPVQTLNAVGVSGASLSIVGAPGQATWCYWASANFPIGSVLSSLGCVPNAANTLSVSNYVSVIPFSYPAGVTTVDILATPTNQAPSGACNCAVATGLTSGGTNHQSNSLSPYTVSILSPQSFRLWLTNEVVGTGATHLMLRNEAGSLVADLSVSTGGGSPVTVNGSGTLTSANLNNTTPAAGGGFLNCTFQVSGANVSLECPSGNTSSTFALGNAPFTVNGQSCTLGGTCAIPFSTNGSANTSVAGLNFVTSTANSAGLTITPSNPATTQEKLEVTGTVVPASGGTGIANTASLTLGSANVNLATLGTGLVKNTTTTGALSNGASADVIGLFTGCSGTQYLGADGACHAAGTGTVTVLGAGTLASTALVTGASAQTAQTPSGTSTLDSSGNLTAAGRVTAASMADSGLSTCQPIGIGSGGLISSSPLYIDASKCGGATVDVLVNTCLGYVYSMLGNLPCDTRAIKSGTVLSPGQTIAAEIDANEPPAPTVSAVSGGSLASGVYKVSYTLVSTYGESSASNESSVTTSGTCPGSGNCSVQVNSPPYPGIATSFNTKMTAAAGASWTEKDCGVSPAIGSNATITAACSGTTVSKSNTATDLILPPTGGWNCTITDGTSYCLKYGDRSYVHGFGNGEGHRFAILTSGSANVGAIVGSDLNTKTAAGYIRVENIGVQNTGGTIGVAAFSFQSFFDSSECKDIDVVNNNSIGALINNGGAGSHCDSLHAEGSSGSGARPLVVGGSGGIGFGAFTCFNCVGVHPGSGNPAIEVPRSQSMVYFAGSTYMEGNTPAGACVDATTPLFKAATVGNVGGLIIDSLETAATCTTSTAPILELENNFSATAFRIGSLYSNRSTTLINDLTTKGPGVTAASCAAGCWYSGPYTWSSSGNVYSGNGIAQRVDALANAPTCAVASEGVYFVANNCNAACTVGGTCAPGGTTHCELRCNSTPAYVETGR